MASEQEEFEFRLRAEREAAQPAVTEEQTRRSPAQMALRTGGLAVRGLAQGVAGLPLAAADVAQRAIGGFTGMPMSAGDVAAMGESGRAPAAVAPWRTPSAAFERQLPKVFPTAETGPERFVQRAAEYGPAIVGGAQLGKQLLAVPLQNIGRGLMASALKPTLRQWQKGDAAVAIDTMLQKGFNATEGGVAKIKKQIDALNEQIKQEIASSPATVDKAAVGTRLNELAEKFKKQVNPDADVNAIKRAWDEFKNHPLLKGRQDIPVQLAQEMKQGTYKQLAKKYGQLGSGEVEAQKALARGLKEEIATAVPKISGLNAEESKLIRTLGVAERRTMMDLNKNPGSLAWLAHNPASFAAFVADKSALFKSLAARMIYRTAPAAGAAMGAPAGVSLYEIGRSERQ